MRKHTEHSEQASFYRMALLLGLIPGQVVVEWAGNILEKGTNVVHTFIDISETSGWDITRLRYLLLELCSEEVNQEILLKVLRIVHQDIKNGNRNINDTLTVLTQMRQFVKIDPIIAEQIKKFEIKYGTKSNDINNDTSIKKWLSQFE